MTLLREYASQGRAEAVKITPPKPKLINCWCCGKTHPWGQSCAGKAPPLPVLRSPKGVAG